MLEGLQPLDLANLLNLHARNAAPKSVIEPSHQAARNPTAHLC